MSLFKEIATFDSQIFSAEPEYISNLRSKGILFLRDDPIPICFLSDPSVIPLSPYNNLDEIISKDLEVDKKEVAQKKLHSYYGQLDDFFRQTPYDNMYEIAPYQKLTKTNV